jgi:hypothetical protein
VHIIKNGGSIDISNLGAFGEVLGKIDALCKSGFPILTSEMPIGKCPFGVSLAKFLKVGEAIY